MLVLAALALGFVGPSPVSPDPTVATAAATPRIERVLLDAAPPLRASLQDALVLRLSPTTVATYEGTLPADGDLHVYVYVPAPRDDHYHVEIIVSDGRAYAREVVAPEAMAGRILGGELALLLRGIEEGTLAPDRRDAVIPGTKDEGQSEVHEAPPAPAADTPKPSVEGQPREVVHPSPDDAPPLELGLFSGAGGAFGVAPATDIAKSGVGLGELGVDLRWPSGGVVSASLRVGGRRSSPFSLVRARIALGGGYVLRRGRLELPLHAWLGLEPWGVRSSGRGTPVVPIDGAARQVPLLGLVVRADPGVRVSFVEGPSLAMRVGPYVELAASAVWSDGVGVPRLHAADTGEVVARLGGLELGLGLSVQLWLAVGQGPSRGRPTRAAP